MVCKNCGASNPDYADFCEYCMSPLEKATNTNKNMNGNNSEKFEYNSYEYDKDHKHGYDKKGYKDDDFDWEKYLEDKIGKFFSKNKLSPAKVIFIILILLIAIPLVMRVGLPLIIFFLILAKFKSNK